jgi:protein-disulfide isomerase
MNTKRIVFWSCFVIVLGLIVWGLAAASNKQSSGPALGTPAPVTAVDHVTGPADAPVTLIEYGDFQCPACGAYYPLVEKLITTDASTSVRLVFRHFPLPQHLNAPLAAQASEAASMQGKFWDMYNMLYQHQNDWANLSDPHSVFEGYAAAIGLDVAKFTIDIDSAAAKQVVSADQAEGETLGIDGTPTFFVNGKAITNPQSYDDFKNLILAAAAGAH